MSSSWIPHPLQWYLVDHPAISTFTWTPPATPLSSLPALLTAVLLYLLLSLLLPRLPLPLPSPSTLRPLSSLHNLLLLLLSLAMSMGCSLSAFSSLPSPLHLFCFPPDTPPSGPLFFWAYIFYLSKLYELVDTLLIILAGPAGRRRLTFLHVYHHAVVVVMCYVWLQARQSLMPVALVTNATVHVVMYSYYLSCSAGRRWPARWKRAVTDLQIWQFVFSFGCSMVFLWLHFFGGGGRGEGCEGMKGWVFNAVFNASLLFLFLDFHSKAYAAGGWEGRKRRIE